MVTTMTELEILNAALAVGWVRFAYYKADGTKRVAIGTRNRALIEQTIGRRLKDNGSDGSFYRNCNGYFDLTRLDWRQFKAERFIGLELDRLSNEQAVTMAIAIAMLEKEPIGVVMDIQAAAEHIIGTPMVAVVTSEIDRAINRGTIVQDLDDVLGFVALHIPSCAVKVTAAAAPQKPKIDRAALKAELAAIRKRESEILEILLAD